MQSIRLLFFVLGALVFAGSSVAADSVVDGKLQIAPTHDGKFAVENVKLGKAELLGYVGDQKDTKQFTGVLLKKGEQASDEQKHIVGEIAQYWKLDAFIEQGREITPLTAE